MADCAWRVLVRYNSVETPECHSSMSLPQPPAPPNTISKARRVDQRGTPVRSTCGAALRCSNPCSAMLTSWVLNDSWGGQRGGGRLRGKILFRVYLGWAPTTALVCNAKTQTPNPLQPAYQSLCPSTHTIYTHTHTNRGAHTQTYTRTHHDTMAASQAESASLLLVLLFFD